MICLGDIFIKQLYDVGEDFINFWVFIELFEFVDKSGVFDIEIIFVGLWKMKEFGIRNVIIEMDLVYVGINYKKFKVEVINDFFIERLKWIYVNLVKDFKVVVNLCDFFDGMIKKLKCVFKVICYLFFLFLVICLFGIVIEEFGKYFLEQFVVWIRVV